METEHTLLNNQWIKEDIREIAKYLEMNKNETSISKLMGCRERSTKEGIHSDIFIEAWLIYIMLVRKFIALNACVKKTRKSSKNNL